MPQFITTFTKSTASTPWIIAQSPYAEAICSEEELNNIVLPSREAVKELPGFISLTVNESSNTTLVMTYSFNTLANAGYAYNNINDFNDAANVKTNLMVSKREAANVVYNVTRVIVD